MQRNESCIFAERRHAPASVLDWRVHFSQVAVSTPSDIYTSTSTIGAPAWLPPVPPPFVLPRCPGLPAALAGLAPAVAFAVKKPQNKETP